MTRVEIVRRLFERFDRDGLETALELIADDFVVEIPGSMSAEPDIHQGHDGARRYLAGFDGLIDDIRYEPLELYDEGDAVIVRLRLSGRGSASGIDVEQHAAVVSWIEDGKVTRMEPHPDLDAARASLRS